MSDPAAVRESGKSQSDEVVAEESKANDVLMEPHEEPDYTPRRSKFRTTGLARMRFDWRGDDGQAVVRARETVEERLLDNFSDAYEILHNVFEIIREAEHDPSTGERKMDERGWPIWKRTISGGYVEDFSRLTRKERENFLFQINTRIFGWEQRKADAWAEAMFAKAQWEDKFSMHYDRPQVGTIEDRTAVGRLEAREERYFTIFMTYYSKKADAVCESMKRLEQRLKDSMDF